MQDGNGWEQWKNHILSSLERIEDVITKLDERCINRIHDCFLEISNDAGKENNVFTKLTDKIVVMETKLAAIDVKLKLITYISATIFSAIIGILLKLILERG